MIHLTLREKQTLELLCKGATNKDVCRALNIAVKTVEKHRTKLYKKLGVHTGVELFRKAIELNLVKCPCYNNKPSEQERHYESSNNRSTTIPKQR